MSQPQGPASGGSTSVFSRSGLPMGTTIYTLAGALAVEALYPGDRVITRDAGAQVLLDIRRHRVPAGTPMVRVTGDALGGKPTQDTVLPGAQRVLIRDWRAQALYGTPAARVPLSRLVDGEYLRWTDDGPDALLSLHFAHPHIIYANGLELFSAEPVSVDA